jgi:hypothetical protein
MAYHNLHLAQEHPNLDSENLACKQNTAEQNGIQK